MPKLRDLDADGSDRELIAAFIIRYSANVSRGDEAADRVIACLIDEFEPTFGSPVPPSVRALLDPRAAAHAGTASAAPSEL